VYAEKNSDNPLVAVFQNIAVSHNKFSPGGSYLTHASTCSAGFGNHSDWFNDLHIHNQFT
jgi:hypothetical protein